MKMVKGGTLNVWTWPDYWSPKNLKAYKAASGTNLNIASYESNDEMFAKLRTAGGAEYDIVIPDVPWLPVLIKAGVLQKLDHERISWQYIDKSLLGPAQDPHNEYSVPKDYAVGGLVYDPVAVGGEIKSWHDYYDAFTRPNVSGKVDALSEPAELLGSALWAMGKSWNTASKAELDEAAKFLMPLMPHVKSINDFDIEGMANGSTVLASMTNANARLAMLQNKKLKWVIPEPKGELILDNYTIAAKAPDVEQAYSYINFMLEPEHQVADTEFLGYPLVLPNIQQMLPKSVKLQEVIFPTPADMERLEALNIREEMQGYAENLFTELKAAA